MHSSSAKAAVSLLALEPSAASLLGKYFASYGWTMGASLDAKRLSK